MLLLIRVFISPNDGDFSDIQQKYFKASKNLLYLKRQFDVNIFSLCINISTQF